MNDIIMIAHVPNTRPITISRETFGGGGSQNIEIEKFPNLLFSP